MVKQNKIDDVKSLVAKLQEKKNIIFTRYSGVKVRSLGVIRNKIREGNADYQVVKNNMFIRALKECGYEGVAEHVKGPLAVAFVNNEVAEIARAMKEFMKEEEKFSLSLGVIDNIVYDETQMMKIADLPSKEVLLSQVMSLINGPASKIAIGTNQIMASLARGINAVAEAQNK
jgi:large subunit ribosomal protein L10